jgi:glycosyltransferase involved in cell wall biosynthesis
MTAELVSILTPSFNQARWLRDNLQSVALQSYPHIEQIVMDGGSTDGSQDILERSGRSVRWRSEPDKGQSDALNKAFDDSRGQIIGWLNSDDAYFRRDAVEMAVRAFHRYPDATVVYGHAVLVNADGLILQMIWVPPFHLRLLRTHNFIIQPATFIRRSAITSHMVDTAFDYAMDRELWLRLAIDNRFVRLDHVLAVDRHHHNRKSLVRQDLAQIDTARLVSMYNVPHGLPTRTRLKSLKIAFRLAGMSIVREVRADLTCQWQVDSMAQLCIRQALIVRAAMPAGEPSSAEER